MSRVKSRNERVRCVTTFQKPSLTRQSEADSCNIHKILSRYQKTGLLPQRQAQPLQGPLPDVDNFHDAMNKVAHATQTFDSLPSDLRKKFDNDPAKFLDFCSKEENLEQMREFGLVKKPPLDPAPQKVQIVNPEPEPEPEPE